MEFEKHSQTPSSVFNGLVLAINDDNIVTGGTNTGG